MKSLILFLNAIWCALTAARAGVPAHPLDHVEPADRCEAAAIREYLTHPV
jgi:hypothetical protein